MPKSENISDDKFRIVIYHGHIHLLSNYNEIGDDDKLNASQFSNKNYVTKIND
ncbi:MAG: hypothetical protein R3255_05600 [Candidatus Lokiarchaeia archaeon]|nr:hypothetical protein [Candidatus Lokiarchaeia archaeon]